MSIIRLVSRVTLVGTALLSILLMSATARAASVDWEGWTFDYSTSDNASGLVLRDVEFGGNKILDRVSMPVMRVEYLRDICGPYADIMSSSTLKPAREGAPNSVCDGEAQCTRTYTQNGEQMLEVGSNWQIGEYQIYQTYYFSENGYFDSRVYSRGLQCLVDHAHHAHWMFDFDIDDAANDRVVRADGSAPATEWNDLRNGTDGWRIEDKVTGNAVSLIPSDDDGAPNDFASVDLAVRAYKSGETGRWRLGARGEIGDNYRNGESVDGADIVLWYVSHLPHSASEGPAIWHASGPRIQTTPDTPPGAAPPPEPSPEPPPEPSPAPSGDNLLANGDFASGKAGWLDCGPSSATSAVATGGADGSAGLRVAGGGCLYQEVDVSAGVDYTLACDADRRGNSWTIMELSYLDENYDSLLSRVAQITTDAGFQRQLVGGTVPTGTARGLALLYSEDDSRFDNCAFVAATLPAEPEVNEPGPDTGSGGGGENLLRNGGFENALGSWYSCSASELAAASADAASGSRALALEDGGCLYQEFDAMPGETYAMRCKARQVAGDAYTSVSFALMDDAYASLERTERPVSTATYADFSAELMAPPASVRGAVTLYSEAIGVFDDCTVGVR